MTTTSALHGDAVGVEIGDLRPRFAELEEHLLHHGKVRHWSEWWDQYVEQPLAGADYDTYRQVMVLIGSLFRRLRPDDSDRLARDEDRERYMWTRIREHLAESGADPAECLHVCGAFHAASRVEQFGLDAEAPAYDISPRTATKWLYGLIPSSHSAIEDAVRAGLGLGVHRRGDLGQGRGARSMSPRTSSCARRPAASGPRAPGRPRRRPHGPVPDRLSGFLADAARPGPPRRGRAARLVRRHRAAGPPQRISGQHGRRHRRVRDLDPARRPARQGQAHAVRFPGRGGHLHREGRRPRPA